MHLGQKCERHDANIYLFVREVYFIAGLRWWISDFLIIRLKVFACVDGILCYAVIVGFDTLYKTFQTITFLAASYLL